MFMQYEKTTWRNPSIITSSFPLVRNIVIKCVSIKILWETYGVDNSRLGFPLVLLSLSFSKHICKGQRTFSSPSSALFKPTTDLNDLYSIYDEIACIITTITGDDISLIPEEFRISVVGLLNNFLALVDKLWWLRSIVMLIKTLKRYRAWGRVFESHLSRKCTFLLNGLDLGFEAISARIR